MRSRRQRGRRTAANKRDGEVFPRIFLHRPEGEAAEHPQFQPMSDIDLKISNGWGDIPQTKIPADWRTRVNA